MRGATIGLILFAFAVSVGAFLVWNAWDLTRTGTASTARGRTLITVAFVAVPAGVIAALVVVSLVF